MSDCKCYLITKLSLNGSSQSNANRGGVHIGSVFGGFDSLLGFLLALLGLAAGGEELAEVRTLGVVQHI